MTTTPRWTRTATAARFNEAKGLVARLTDSTADLAKRTAVLERKSRGITLANARAARLEATSDIGTVEELKAQLLAAGVAFNDAKSPRALAGASQTIVDIHGELDELDASVNERFKTVNATLAKHAGRLTVLEEGHRNLSDRIDTIEPARVVRWWQLLIALLAGLAAGIAWAVHSFTEHHLAPNGQDIPVTHPLPESFWVAALAGLTGFAFTLALLILFARAKKANRTTEIRDEATEAPVEEPVVERRSIHTIVVPPRGEPAVDPTPTSVLPRTDDKGVRVDTRP